MPAQEENVSFSVNEGWTVEIGFPFHGSGSLARQPFDEYLPRKVAFRLVRFYRLFDIELDELKETRDLVALRRDYPTGIALRALATTVTGASWSIAAAEG